MYLIMLTFCSQ